MAKVLSKVPISPVGESPHVQSTSDFVNKTKKITLQLLEKDEKLLDRTVLTVQNIIDLLGFCLHNKYFSFQNRFYEQVKRAAMGSLVNPIVANLYMEHFEREALWSASNPPRFWFRYVDDTWVIQQRVHKQEFLEHMNSIDPAIKFTVEGTQGNGSIPFFDTLVTPEADNSLSFTVYCCVMKEWMVVSNRVKDNCNIFQLHLILFVVYNYVERK